MLVNKRVNSFKWSFWGSTLYWTICFVLFKSLMMKLTHRGPQRDALGIIRLFHAIKKRHLCLCILYIDIKSMSNSNKTLITLYCWDPQSLPAAGFGTDTKFRYKFCIPQATGVIFLNIFLIVFVGDWMFSALASQQQGHTFKFQIQGRGVEFAGFFHFVWMGSLHYPKKKNGSSCGDESPIAVCQLLTEIL